MAARATEASAPNKATTAPETVVLTVTSEPEGAVVFLDEQRLGSTPLRLETPTGPETHTLRVVKGGFRTTTRQLVLDQDRSLAVSLRRRRQNPTGPGPSALPLKTNY